MRSEEHDGEQESITEGNLAVADDVAPETIGGDEGESGDGLDPQAPEDPQATPALGALGDEELLAAVTSLVFATPDPLSERKLAALCGGEGKAPALPRVRAALEKLKERLLASGLPLELRSIAGGWQILTVPESGAIVQRLFEARKSERISPAALETLAIVAYRQPVTKAEIEAIRGVQAGPILRALVDRDLIKVSGRADVPGHPLQYETTKTFLDRFGLAGLDDLPRDSELLK